MTDWPVPEPGGLRSQVKASASGAFSSLRPQPPLTAPAHPAPKGACALTSAESSKAKTSEALGKLGDYPKWTEEGSAPSCPMVTWLTRQETRTEWKQGCSAGPMRGTMAHDGSESWWLSRRKAGLRCIHTNPKPRTQGELHTIRKREIRK